MRPDPYAVSATASVSCRDGRLTWTSAPPVVLRRTGPRRLHLVQVGGGPLGGDVLRLDVELGAGEELELRAAAATLVQRGRDDAVASFALNARLAAGAVLHWRPGPCVVAAGARWDGSVRAELAAGARLGLREQLVLGRHGEPGGWARSELVVDVEGRPLLATATEVDGDDPAGWGPGGTGGARSVGTLVEVGSGSDGDERAGEEPDVVWARSPLAGPGWTLTALGSVPAVAAVLDREQVGSAPAGPTRGQDKRS